MISRRKLLQTSAITVIPAVGFISKTTATKSEGKITDIKTPNIIRSEETFTITVNTTQSIATVVSVKAPDANIDVSSPDKFETKENEIRFVDPKKSDSSYDITINLENANPNNTVTVAAWTDHEDKESASDSEERSIPITNNNVTIENAQLNNSKITEGKINKRSLELNIANISTDDKPDIIEFELPQQTTLQEVTDITATNVSIISYKTDNNEVKITINSKNTTTTTNTKMKIDMKLKA